MTKSQIPPFAATSTIPNHIADMTEVNGVLVADEIRQINFVPDEESELDESLDEVAANEEEDDELEEEAATEAAAEANRH